jgi:hypothetical protein
MFESAHKGSVFSARQRRAKGPPFRMTIEYPLPVLAPAEEAEALAQAEYDDDMGNFAWEPGTYIVLHAQNAEDAKAEAERIWHTEPHGADAIGYVICSRDWSHVYSFRLDGSRRWG